MFDKKPDVLNEKLEEEILRVIEKMTSIDPDSDEYAKYLERLNKLADLKETSKKKTPKVSTDTIVMVAGNLAGIIMILGFERAHVVTSKALGFVLKPRA